MKILLTGSTPMQVGRTERYYSQCHAVSAALEILGHTVEHRPVPIKEALAGAPRFDRLILFQAPYLMFGANYSLASLILSQTRRDAVLAFEDGTRLADIAAHYRQIVRHPAYLYDRLIGRGKRDRDEAVANARARRVIDASVAEFAEPIWKRPSLVALFPWGSVAALPESARGLFSRAVVYDPSPLVPVPPVKRQRKERRWVLASLGNHARWVGQRGLTWPVTAFGFHGARVGEAAVVQAYADAWGVLGLDTKVSAAGWWRARFNFTARVGSILLCDPTDAAAVAHPEAYGSWANRIERMSVSALTDLAAEQHRVMTRRTWSKTHLLEVMRGVIEQPRSKAA